jgi:hypothetical protein
MKKKILRALRLDKISGVDRPAQEPALAQAIVKSENPAAEEATMNEEIEKAEEAIEEVVETPVEEVAKDEAPAEEPAAEEAPAEEPAAEEAPAEEAPAEEAPAEEPAAEEAAAEEAPAEEAPAEVEKSEGQVALVYKSLAGDEFTTNDDPRLIEAVKRADALESEKIEIEKAAYVARLRKSAEENLNNCPGGEAMKLELLKAVDGMGDEYREGVMELLKAANGALEGAFVERGTSEASPSEPQSFTEAYENLAKSFSEENNCSLTEARVKVMYTQAFEDLYNQGR